MMSRNDVCQGGRRKHIAVCPTMTYIIYAIGFVYCCFRDWYKIYKTPSTVSAEEQHISDANLRLLVKTVYVHQNEDKSLDVRLEFNGDFEDSVAVYVEEESA